MIISESYLRKIIRKALLTESAKSPKEIPDDTIIVVRSSPGIGGSVSFKYLVRRRVPPVIGMVTWDDPGPDKPNYVTTASADGGWGPLLYDLAIELSGRKGLMPDRWEVSEEARSVWNYYMNRRPDIEFLQYDNKQNELTPPIEDNVDQHSAEEDPTVRAWYKSSLSKAYRKRGGTTPVLDSLKSLGKIQFESYEDSEEL